jgi:hypothetical protein
MPIGLIQDVLGLQPRSFETRSKVLRADPRSYFFTIMKSKHKVRIARTMEDFMRTSCLSLDLPAQSI